jgi:hypothetical protein
MVFVFLTNPLPLKNILISVSLFVYIGFPGNNSRSFSFRNSSAQNIFIITTDGFRWQEVFKGADTAILYDEKYAGVNGQLKKIYCRATFTEQRKCLMPFLWTTIAENGQLYGNRQEGNYMNTANLYGISYPGYNELLTGTTDPFIYSNDKKQNPNINVLEWLADKDAFRDRVAAFTSWNLFPYILNSQRNNLYINTDENKKVRPDSLTFSEAKSYLEANHPKLLYLSLGETDEFAHSNRYDLYLQQAHRVDSMIAELWQWTQQTAGYKDNTLFIITTDHGRGALPQNWKTHGPFTKGSSQTWMACIGPGILPFGEIKTEGQLYNRQMAAAIAEAAGYEFKK